MQQPIGHALLEVRNALVRRGRASGLEAQLLVAEAAGRSRAWVLSHPEADLLPDQSRCLEESLNRLLSGQPLAYVLGWREFYGRRFVVTPDVLIPRPETEALVEAGLSYLRPRRAGSLVLDVGTGSGCLAVTLACGNGQCTVIASDISPEAVHVARQNARLHRVADRVQFLVADLLPPLAEPADLLVANLPYLPRKRLVGLDVARTEPRQALDGGPDGLDLIGRVLDRLPTFLADGGRAILEIDSGQMAPVISAVHTRFPGWPVQGLQDLAGLDRVVIIDRPG